MYIFLKISIDVRFVRFYDQFGENRVLSGQIKHKKTDFTQILVANGTQA